MTDPQPQQQRPNPVRGLFCDGSRLRAFSFDLRFRSAYFGEVIYCELPL
jgi:hypothetical protein